MSTQTEATRAMERARTDGDPPSGMQLFGYTDRLSVCPGESVSVMVSSVPGRFDARLVRLYHGDHHPAGPGYKAVHVSSGLEGSYAGREQPLRLGSHVEVERMSLPPNFAIATWAWPSLLGEGERGLLGHVTWRKAGIALTLDQEGAVALWADGEQVARSDVRVQHRTWHLITASYDRDAGTAVVGIGRAGGTMSFTERSLGGRSDVPFEPGSAFWIGACDADSHYNGKLEDPLVLGRPLTNDECERMHADALAPGDLQQLVARWEFAPSGSRHVPDASGQGHDGRLINRPTRAVTGRRWERAEVDFRRDPKQYAALHFHDDDLDDAAWETSLTWTVPEDLSSGVYGIELRSGTAEDVIPIFVRPRRGTATSPVALLIPTFSYVAYANEHVNSRPELREHFERRGGAMDYPVQAQDVTILAERLHSLYDRHSDGSGVCYASWRRPLLNVRPGWHEPDLSMGRGAAHQLSADLHLVDWLHEKGYAVDIITDGDLHDEGPQLLARYRVVITGSHPEYVSERMLDSFSEYLQDGGRVMYVGGNGFYWVTELDPEEAHTIEVRRWGAASRLWDARPGEWYLSSTGTLGGLWRFRDRAPQRLFGVGTTAMGSGPNRPYERTAASFEESVNWVFEGLGDRAEIGAHPALVNDWGAGGYEIDRADAELGTPEGTVVLATARGFSDSYQHVVDEVLTSDSRQGGSVNPLVRADMVLVPHPRGGAVFSPGSISWCSCLSYNDYDNDVSRITANVLDRFLHDDELRWAGGGVDDTGARGVAPPES